MKRVEVVVGKENSWLNSLHSKRGNGLVLRGDSDSDVRNDLGNLLVATKGDLVVEVKGGLLGYCVRRVAEQSLDGGAFTEINLLYCAIESIDDIKDAPPQLLQRRLEELRFRMRREYYEHPRLSIVTRCEKNWD